MIIFNIGGMKVDRTNHKEGNIRQKVTTEEKKKTKTATSHTQYKIRGLHINLNIC